MRELEPTGDLPRDVQRVVDGERALARDARLERSPAYSAIARNSCPSSSSPPRRCCTGWDGRAHQRRALLGETAPPSFIDLLRHERDLERDVAPETRVFGPVDDAHAAGPDRRNDSEMRDGATHEAQRIGDGRERRRKQVALHDVGNALPQGRQSLVRHLVAGEQRSMAALAPDRYSRSRSAARVAWRHPDRTARGTAHTSHATAARRLAHEASGASCDASHARAARRSRLIVLTETLIAPAMSSSERPPK